MYFRFIGRYAKPNPGNFFKSRQAEFFLAERKMMLPETNDNLFACAQINRQRPALYCSRQLQVSHPPKHIPPKQEPELLTAQMRPDPQHLRITYTRPKTHKQQIFGLRKGSPLFVQPGNGVECRSGQDDQPDL